MIVALGPHGEVENAQALQRLAERPGRTGRHAVEHVGQRRVALRSGIGRVSGRQGQNRVDGQAHRGVLAAVGEGISNGDQALSHHGRVVRREIAHIAQLVDGVPCADVRPFLVGELPRQVRNRPRERDQLARQQHRRLRVQRALQANRRAHRVRQRGIAPGALHVFLRRPAIDMVPLIPLKPLQHFDSFRHKLNSSAFFLLYNHYTGFSHRSIVQISLILRGY